MTLREAYRRAAAAFAEAGIPDPEVDSSLLLSLVTGEAALMVRLSAAPLPPEAEAAFQHLCARRMRREPLQYILGTQPFYGRDFRVDPRVLIPRPETELLAEKAIAALRAVPGGSPAALDLCCGSGCLCVTLALECPSAHVCGCDLSEDALAVTRQNRDALGADVTLFQGDLWAALPEKARFDVIVSNPPYIPRGDCAHLQSEVLREPLMALDGGEDGLDFYRRIASGAARFLRPGGTLLLEVGYDQAAQVASLLQDGFAEIRLHRDLSGILRMVEARRKEGAEG